MGETRQTRVLVEEHEGKAQLQLEDNHQGEDTQKVVDNLPAAEVDNPQEVGSQLHHH